ncbi:hypothetical protein R1flu_027507 [Riccia fluitans]|uniref:CCHC-type domain-containing protein n=1 Tax=Riccia fluitans TaxID=41844 RepID=A0ABD1XJ04_9MARC
MHAKHKLWSCTMKDGDDLLVHLQKFTSLSCEIVVLSDQPMNDEDKAFMLLWSLSNFLEHLVQTLMYGKDQLSFDDVYFALLSKDSRKMIGKTKASSTTLIVERGRTHDRFGNGKAKGGSRARSKSREKSQHNKIELKCWKCGKMGHMKKDCRDKAKASEASTSQANVATNQTKMDLLSDEDNSILYDGRSMLSIQHPIRYRMCGFQILHVRFIFSIIP